MCTHVCSRCVRLGTCGSSSRTQEGKTEGGRGGDVILSIRGNQSWDPATLSPLLAHPASEPERSLRPYSLVRPLLVSALRPVVLLPECLAPRLIRNLLDLPSSRLDFQVCPAGEPVAWEGRLGNSRTARHVALQCPIPLPLQKASLGRSSVHPQHRGPPSPGLPPQGWATGSEPSWSLLGR